jgi:hypothetical protein
MDTTNAPTCQCPRDDSADPPLCGKPAHKTCIHPEVCDDCAREIEADDEGCLILDLLYGTTRPDSCKPN